MTSSPSDIIRGSESCEVPFENGRKLDERRAAWAAQTTCRIEFCSPPSDSLVPFNWNSIGDDQHDVIFTSQWVADASPPAGLGEQYDGTARSHARSSSRGGGPLKQRLSFQGVDFDRMKQLGDPVGHLVRANRSTYRMVPDSTSHPRVFPGASFRCCGAAHFDLSALAYCPIRHEPLTLMLYSKLASSLCSSLVIGTEINL